MTKRKTTAKSMPQGIPASVAPDPQMADQQRPRRWRLAKSFCTFLAKEVEEHGYRCAPALFEQVASDVRELLDEPDAALIAGWFDRLAAGEDARKVFFQKRTAGRPLGKTKPRISIGFSGTTLDDTTIAEIIHVNLTKIKNGDKRILRNVANSARKVGEFYKRLGKALNMNPRTLRRIYTRHKPRN